MFMLAAAFLILLVLVLYMLVLNLILTMVVMLMLVCICKKCKHGNLLAPKAKRAKRAAGGFLYKNSSCSVQWWFLLCYRGPTHRDGKSGGGQ